MLIDGFYTVVKGALKLTIDNPKTGEHFEKVFGPGEHFGERVLVKSALRTGLVVALEDSVVLWISQKDFTRLARAFPFLDTYFKDYIESTFGGPDKAFAPGSAETRRGARDHALSHWRLGAGERRRAAADGAPRNPYIPLIMAIADNKIEAAGRPVAKGDHVYLVDGSGYIFRAYHALPPLTRPSDGLPVGAVHGFCGMLWKLLRETGELGPPTHLAVIFDYSARTFRNDLFDGYKANRPELPEDLIPQFPLIRDAVKAFNVACIEMEGYEADDLIATYACQALASRRRRDHRLLRQGSDAARAARHPHVRHHEEQGDRRGRGDRAFRRAALEGDRGAGADRRFHR